MSGKPILTNIFAFYVKAPKEMSQDWERFVLHIASLTTGEGFDDTFLGELLNMCIILFCHLQLKSHVQEGCCMDIRTDLKAQDQVADVLRYFNVKVTSKDIFSRCQVRNSDSWAHCMQGMVSSN